MRVRVSPTAQNHHMRKFQMKLPLFLSLLVIPSFKEIAVLVNDGSKLGDFRADFDGSVAKVCVSINK